MSSSTSSHWYLSESPTWRFLGDFVALGGGIDDGRHRFTAGDSVMVVGVKSIESAAQIVVVIVSLAERSAGGDGTRGRVSRRRGRRRWEVIA